MAKWTEDYSIGVKLFDDQHKRLFELVNELGSSLAFGKDRESLLTVFDNLVGYVTKHFADEERLMIEHGYPEYDAHKKEHNTMAETVLSLRGEIVKGNKTIATQSLPILINWIHNHMSGTDSRYTDFFHSKGVY